MGGVSAPGRAATAEDGRWPPLELIVVVVGAASLGAEIAAARLLAPWFGASTIVWANTIGTVLVALSLGYWLGGRAADRRPDRRSLCAVVLAAGVLLALVPVVSQPLLSVSVKAFSSLSAGAFLGSLAGVLVLVAVPVALLGCAAPWALRIALRDPRESGRVAGRLYALSTAGSLVGVFAAALGLVPFVGTRRTFELFALCLALVAAPALRWRWRALLAVPVVLVALPTGTIKASANGARVIYETETPYQYARVLQAPDGVRTLELDEGLAVHSELPAQGWLTGNYWDGMMLDPLLLRGRAPMAVAVLGNAGGTSVRQLGHFFPRTRIDAVELDGRLSDIGRRYFDMVAPHLRVITADARPYLRSTSRRYDAILIDAYRQPYIPFYLTTREFFALVARRLTPGGVVVVNVGHPSTSHALERALAATMRADFAVVTSDPVEPENTLLLAGDRASAGHPALPTDLPPELTGPAQTARARLRPAPRGGPVWTDDRAPVEWLIDRSIVNYAARGQ
ncbi:MAG: spermine synthase [Actinobacteria bacterium]|nr:MAG: spermine synthase [Actinomycetota bacterium]